VTSSRKSSDTVKRDINNETESNDGFSIPKNYCLCLVEFISSLATDPHLYFQHKLTAAVSAAENSQGLMMLLGQLMDWIESIHFQPIQISKLDKMLNDQGMASYSLMRSLNNQELRLALASGRVVTEEECFVVREDVLNNGKITHSDRMIVERILRAHESSE
jgi:hypothetical protein